MNKTEKLMDSQYESLDHLGITPRALSQNKQELSLVPTMVWQKQFSPRKSPSSNSGNTWLGVSFGEGSNEGKKPDRLR